MKDNIRELIEKHQVRKSFSQKTEFIYWLDDKSKSLGYELKVETNKKCRNLVMGDVKNAKVILTAHYDTQANAFIPMFMGMNWQGFILSQIYILSVFYFILNALTYILTKLSFPMANIISVFFMFLYLYQFQYGIANKHTVNDNTSGVITLLEVMEKLSVEERKNIAFVFFDQEELGLIGSKHFKNKYYKYIGNTPLINFDCVANGNHLAFIKRKEFRLSQANSLLDNSLEREKSKTDKEFLIGPAIKYIYPSDQLHFKNSVAVAALKKAPILGYYLNGIHNSRDRIFQEENIETISNIVIDFIGQLEQ